MVALAVHGVANRSEDAFARSVARFALLAGLDADALVPVYWGDFGSTGPLASIPSASDSAALEPPVGAFAAAPPADLQAAAAETEAETLRQLEARTGDVHPLVPAEVAAAVQTAVDRGWSVALSSLVAPILVDTIVTSPVPTPDAVGAFGIDWLRDRLVDVLEHVNDALVDLLVKEFRQREAGLGAMIARTLGDVLVYQSRGPEIRGAIDAAYRRAVADGAEHLDVIAHSLGALATVEWLLGASVAGAGTEPGERRVRHLVTFGTQVSLFAELAGLRRHGDPEFGPGPGAQALPLPVDSWTNVWQELDPLAFVMGRVLSIDGAPTPPGIVDLRLTQERIPTDVSFHSSYWTDERFAKWVGGRVRK